MTSPACSDGDVKLQSVIGLDDWYNEIGAATDAAIDEANLTLPTDKQLVKDDTIITSFENLFKDNTLLRELETLENWDVSTVTNMAGMFWGAATLNDISQLNNWTTAQVTTMENMFRGMLKLRKVDAVVNWDTSSCANFDGMFQDCKTVVSVDLTSPNWTTDAAIFPNGDGTNRLQAINMLAGMDALKFLYVKPTTILTGTGLEKSDTHEGRDGRWTLQTINGYVPWWGSATDLVERYPMEYNPELDPFGGPDGMNLTYRFEFGKPGGRFESNKFGWWYFDNDPESETYKTLVIGVDTEWVQVTVTKDGSGNKSFSYTKVPVDNFVVTETADYLPWLTPASGRHRAHARGDPSAHRAYLLQQQRHHADGHLALVLRAHKPQGRRPSRCRDEPDALHRRPLRRRRQARDAQHGQ